MGFRSRGSRQIDTEQPLSQNQAAKDGRGNGKGVRALFSLRSLYSGDLIVQDVDPSRRLSRVSKNRKSRFNESPTANASGHQQGMLQGRQSFQNRALRPKMAQKATDPVSVSAMFGQANFVLCCATRTPDPV